jgi:hypothetical protein
VRRLRVPDELHRPLKHTWFAVGGRIGSSGQDLAEIDIEEIAVGQARVTIAKAKRGGHRDLFSRVQSYAGVDSPPSPVVRAVASLNCDLGTLAWTDLGIERSD